MEGGATMPGNSVESGKHIAGSTLMQSSDHVQGRCVVQGSVAADNVCMINLPGPGL